MGSHPTLDHRQLAAEAHELDPDDWTHRHAAAHLTADHPQVRAWPDDNPYTAHDQDHRDWNYAHTHLPHQRDTEPVFDRLNPTFGVPADTHNPDRPQRRPRPGGRLRPRARVAIHDQRQNDPNPVIWQAGQDYRMADALQAARHQPTHTRHGPEPLGPER